MRHKFHISDWGKSSRFKVLNKFVRHFGKPIFYGVTLLVLAAGIFFAFKLFLVLIQERISRSSITDLTRISRQTSLPGEKVQPLSELAPVETSMSSPPEKDLIHSTFYDLFSGVGWLNQEASTLYRDSVVSAFVFPPKFDWQKIENQSSMVNGQLSFVERQPDGSDTRCLGSRCLRQKDLNLYFQNQPLNLPADLADKNLINISIGGLDTVWLLGAVVQNDNNYDGLVFIFNGTGFMKADLSFSSPYKGVIGFGGSDDDWLAVYGAYQGQAVRVRGTDIKNISSFFNIRVMNGGFEPAVVRSINENCELSAEGGFASGGKIENCAAWYIFGLPPSQPKLLKLFQNRTADIVGAVDLTSSIVSEGIRSFSFSSISGESRELAAKVFKNSGASEFWRFRDLGFDKSKVLEAVSVNVNSYGNSETRKATISEVDLDSNGGQVDFYLSNNGVNWMKTGVGEEVEFSESHNHLLFWRVVFSPSSEPETSVFFDRIRLDYKVKFL